MFYASYISNNWENKILEREMEKAMATHSSVLAWRIQGSGEPAGLQSVGLHRVRHNWSNLAAAAAQRENSFERIYKEM